MSLGKSDAPQPPDYVGAARTQGAANLQAAIANNILSHPTQITPYGTFTYAQTGTQNIPGAEGNPAVDIPTFTQTQELTPEGQQLADIYQQINLGLGQTAQTGLGYVQDALNQPFDWSKVANAPVRPGKTGQDAILARLNPQIQMQNDAFAQQMANQGIAPGSVAYENAHRALAQQQNDLMSQAALYGIGLDTSARQQQIQEQEFGRTEPLNIINALRSSAPVQMPQFTAQPASNYQPGNILGATQAQGQADMARYNAEAAQDASLMNGLFSLGGAALMGGFNPFSFGGGAAGGALGGSSFGLQSNPFVLNSFYPMR